MKNQSGFTLLSMMLALSILLIILSLAVAITQFMVNSFTASLITQKETQLFFAQTTTELHLSQAVRSSEDQHTLYLNKGSDTISYQFVSSGRIIRQVNAQGYEIVLQSVKAAEFISDGSLLSIHVTDQANRSYYWDDYLYVKEDGEHSSISK
ncbi:competence type IV pilus minor pilin ComGF [Sporolactobacillus kofuensis]|uniref:Competence type IV pilus minor pilin ComGF n=1 Tax=Sporolactobacillus kofuensis TaxID=269672 RepID=A0ABW1WHD2_9BACL|nr:competence type IV pilus minor pilin ComGF [Sporolactobacillus kofuensis]MCO7176518.1 prepilin-type N-terminal cleavage/methylation domain-containing protein [Sporolactobacillus kofuensis]